MSDSLVKYQTGCHSTGLVLQSSCPPGTPAHVPCPHCSRLTLATFCRKNIVRCRDQTMKMLQGGDHRGMKGAGLLYGIQPLMSCCSDGRGQTDKWPWTFDRFAFYSSWPDACGCSQLIHKAACCLLDTRRIIFMVAVKCLKVCPLYLPGNAF